MNRWNIDSTPRFPQEERRHAFPGTCLPRNLSDEWLTTLVRAVDAMLRGSEAIDLGEALDPEDAKPLAVAALLPILWARAAGRSVLINWEELHKYLNDLRLEFALETVHRQTDMKYEPASLATIFTDRDVRVWRE